MREEWLKKALAFLLDIPTCQPLTWKAKGYIDQSRQFGEDEEATVCCMLVGGWFLCKLPILPVSMQQPPTPPSRQSLAASMPLYEADDEKEHWQPHLSNWVEALSWQLSIRLAEGVGWWWLVGKLEKRLPPPVAAHRGLLWRLLLLLLPSLPLLLALGSIQGVVNVFREPLWRTDDVWRLLFLLCQETRRRRKRWEPFQPTMERERHCFLFYATIEALYN